jgi:bifunctional ADP-heptose synthase (sugar kinase/adenylyltransferase)
MPDYLFKWWDYKAEDVVWYKEVTENWWEIIIIPTVQGYSTTNSVNKILSIK